MFSFFRRSKKDANHHQNQHHHRPEENRNYVTDEEKTTSPTRNTNMCNNKLATTVASVAISTSSDELRPSSSVTLPPKSSLNSVKNDTAVLNETKSFPTTPTNKTNDVDDPLLLERQTIKKTDINQMSYANIAAIMKKTPEPPKRSHSVKPCGHGTVAIAPRIPISAAKREFVTPPESPTQEHKKLYQLRPAVKTTASPAEKEQQPVVVILESDKDEEKKKVEEESDGTRMMNICGSDLSVSSGDSGITSASDDTTTSSDDANTKNLINQEATFQSQVNDLSKQLSHRDGEASKLRFEMDELQRDVFSKTAGMDRLQTELNNAHKESEQIRHRLKLLENDLQDFRQKNTDLADELSSKTDYFSRSETESTTKLIHLEGIIKTLNDRIETLECELAELNQEKEKKEHEHATLITEQTRDKKSIEESLQQALRDKLIIDKKWEQEFEKLRTINIMKEQQLLDDFEWKLREVEKLCKKRLEDKDHSLHEKLNEAYKGAAEKMKLAEDMMSEVKHLKSCEEEVGKLRVLNKDQEKSVHELIEKQARMKDAEDGLREEAKKLRSLIELEKENLQHMQRVHYHQILEKERWLHRTLDEKRCEIAVYWEDKLRNECCRLKYEMEQMHNEEKVFAISIANERKEEELEEAKKSWNRKMEERVKEINALKATLQEKEDFYNKQLEEQQSHTDKDIMELRRIMDKIDMSHHDRFEKLMLDHDSELERLNEEKDKRIQDLESSYSSEVATLKATLEMVKQQMEMDSQEKIESLISQHRSELDTQWANLVHQKSSAVKILEHEYVGKQRTLEDQCHVQQKSHEAREIELLKTIDTLRHEVGDREATIDEMQVNVDTLEGGVQVLNQEIAHQGEQLMRNRREADQKMRGLQEVLTKLQALQEQERDEFHMKLQQSQKQSQTSIDHLQRKCQCLSKLFEEVRGRYERRESRQEDLNIISDLRQVISEQEKDITCLNEEKRHFQMQLIKLQRNEAGNDDDTNSDSVHDDSHSNVDDDDFEDTIEDFTQVKTDSRRQFVPPQLMNPMNGPHNFSIPPTIIECDDDFED